MASIRLYCDSMSNDTIVPNKFIEEYMPEASGEFVKVYLYLLRSIQSHASDCSISKIADLFNHTEKDIIRAIKYWERQGLMSIDYNSDKTISGIHFIDFQNSDGGYEITSSSPVSGNTSFSSNASVETLNSENSKSTIDPMAVKNSIIEPAKREFSLDEIKEFCKDPEVAEMIFIIETYLKHPLNSSDQNYVFYWLEELHFTPELIEYLVEYCISKGHSSLRYMDKVALSWAKEDITTVEQAKENAAIHSKAYYAVIKALGISGRNLADSEAALVTKWSREFGFDIDLIQEACKRTISATHQPSFEYTDSILTKWHNSKVHNLADVSKLDENFSKNRKLTAQSSESNATPKRTATKRYKNFTERNLDVDKLEKVLLTTSVQ
ncbi:MAG: DnaD domain protein [Agathobacter sp.]|nr:DnaD domain protein [Agathobacter sp.]